MRSLAALLVVLLIVGSATGAGASQSVDRRPDAPNRVSPSPGAPAVATETAANTTNSSWTNISVRERTVMHITLRENGNARWNVTARYALTDENETEAFRQLAAEYESGRADVGLTSTLFERVVRRVNADSDRPMALRNPSRSTELRNNGSVGVFSLSFTWTNFTRVADNRIVLGDAFWIGSDTWLPALNADQTLVITWPRNYYITGASPSGGQISNGTVLRYEGPQEFDRGDFAVAVSPKSTETSKKSPDGFPYLSSPWSLLAVLLLFGGSFGVYALAQRRGVSSTPFEDDEAPDASPTVATDDERSDDGPDDASEDDDGPVTELLSDEERVLRLLRDNDGRMKQSQIVNETNWSNAKVSQLLSKMADNDDVNKLRIGRENLITLPDEDVTDLE